MPAKLTFRHLQQELGMKPLPGGVKYCIAILLLSHKNSFHLRRKTKKNGVYFFKIQKQISFDTDNNFRIPITLLY